MKAEMVIETDAGGDKTYIQVFVALHCNSIDITLIPLLVSNKFVNLVCS